MNSKEMTEALAQLNDDAVVVDNLTQFFGRQNLERAMVEVSEFLPELLLDRGVTVTAEEIDLLKQANDLRTRLFGAMVTPVSAYPFADVPEGWVFDDQILIKTQMIKRNQDGGYSVGHKALRRIWDAVSPVWAGLKNIKGTLLTVRIGSYTREVDLLSNGEIKIGCQNIKRFELEQVALRMGWPMPQA
jgi:hypothetical protein